MAGGAERVTSQPPAWGDVYDELAHELSRGPLDVEDLERLAVAAFLTGRDDESVAAWERAHQVWLRLDDPDRAARCAFWVGLSLLLQGEPAQASGWFGRGRRVVAGVGRPCAGYGYLLVPAAMEALDDGDVRRSEALYAEVGEIAEHCGDADLASLALLGMGEAAIAGGRIKEGLSLLDEVMVTATTGGVSPVTTGILYCAVIDACVHAHDLRRAAEWTDALERWCDGQPGLVPYRGQCLAHRSQIFQAHGSWPEALDAAADAQRRLARPPHPAIGVAHYQEGEIHRLRGDFSGADQAYRRASEHGRTPTPGLALLRLAEGDVPAAAAAVRRMLDESRDQPSRLAVLPAFVEVTVAAGDTDAARVASEELDRIAEQVDNPLVSHLADHAGATVLRAEGRALEALDRARRACAGWRHLGMPYEAARSQVEVGLACRVLGDHDTAALELDAARAVFERLGARPDAARTDELRAGGARVASGDLTARECEVLRLVADGMTNREIAAALVISEHTVARHVQNIFAKLGVSSRAAATASAYERGLV